MKPKKEQIIKNIHNIGELVLNELNIGLYNAEPTPHKAFQIYNELMQLGYNDRNKSRACSEIRKYFLTRTVRNHSRQFYSSFNIVFKPEMNRFLALSFKTATITDAEIKDVANNVDNILRKLKVVHGHGVDSDVLFEAITELYNPRYYENEWQFSISILFKKIKKILLYKGKSEFLTELEEIFTDIDPTVIKKKYPGEESEEDSQIQGYEDDMTSVKEKDRFKERHCKRNFDVGDFNDETYVHNSCILKDSEVTYVKNILLALTSAEQVNLLDDSLYQNFNRHPVITTFLNAVKTYNKIIWFDEGSSRETLAALKVTVRAIKDIGQNIITNHERRIFEEGQRLLGETG